MSPPEFGPSIVTIPVTPSREVWRGMSPKARQRFVEEVTDALNRQVERQREEAERQREEAEHLRALAEARADEETRRRVALEAQFAALLAERGR